MGNISHTVIENVATLNNLEELNIFNTENNLMNLNPLKNLGQLSSLEIKCPSVRYRNELFSVETNSFIVLKKLKKLTIIEFNISQNNLDEIGSLSNLEELNFESCNFDSKLNFDSFKNLKNLSILKFKSFKSGGSGLNQIPDSFGSLSKLKELTITKNEVTSFSKKLSNLKNLELLDLSNNSINDVIPESLKKLSKLNYIDFSGNSNVKGKTLVNENLKTCIYDSISVCMTKNMNCFSNKDALMEKCGFNQSSKKYKNDCEAIKTYLTEKNINNEKTIEECIYNDNGRLSKLKLDDSKISEDDVKRILSYDTIENLTVYWSGSQYTIDFIHNLSNLKSLRLFIKKGGKINLKLLSTLNKLTNLELTCPYTNSFSLEENSLKGLKAIKTLYFKEFVLSQNVINEIGQLSSIEKIDFESCDFSQEINYSPLIYLKELSHIKLYSYNKYGKPIYNIPLAFYSITSLKELTIAHQHLTSISEDILNLKNLEYLNLKNNDIESIPESLNHLTNLKQVYFNGNSNLKGKTLTNPSLEACMYDNISTLCKTKNMSCFDVGTDLLRLCSSTNSSTITRTKFMTKTSIIKTVTVTVKKRSNPTN
jgi:Leucine-rich repeat (LRR) protein